MYLVRACDGVFTVAQRSRKKDAKERFNAFYIGFIPVVFPGFLLDRRLKRASIWTTE